MTERTIIGAVTCTDCGRKVELRVNKAGRAYWRCDGVLADDACNTSHTYGPGPSKQAIARAQEPAPQPVAAKPKPAAPRPQPPAAPAVATKKDGWTW